MLTRRHFLSLSGGALLSPAAARAGNCTESIGGHAFGTYWRLTVPDGSAAAIRTGRLVKIINSVDRGFSPYRADSELSAFNRDATGGWLPASAPMRRVLDNALRVARQTGGAFDPTIGPVVSRYGFGPIQSAAWGQFDRLRVGVDGIRKQDPRLSLDLCGIAKGYALDRLTAELDAQGLTDFLLDLGGELSARGAHPSGRPWQVAVQGLASQFPAALVLNDRAVATSGIAAQSYGRAGRLVSHIIDPHTGAPVSGATAAVSVLGKSAMQADGWATALMAMPHERAIDTAGKFSIDALFLICDGTSLRPVLTGAFANYLLT